MNNSTGCLKWSNGSLKQQSMKNEKDKYLKKGDIPVLDNGNPKHYNETVIQQACIDNFDEMDARLFRQPVEDFKLNNKKEENNLKFLEREQVGNRNMNPFLTNSNYVEDVVNRDASLMPKDSNYIEKV